LINKEDGRSSDGGKNKGHREDQNSKSERFYEDGPVLGIKALFFSFDHYARESRYGHDFSAFAASNPFPGNMFL
jgi:hypothetical protein